MNEIDFNEIIEKIKNEDIEPTPKWYFKLRKGYWLVLFLFFILIGSIAFSIILFAIREVDFNLLTHMGHSTGELILALVPLIWIVLLVLFLSGSLYAIYHTDKGYKFRFIELIAANVSLSVLIGTFIFLVGGAQWLETSFALKTEFYESIESRKEKIWHNPDAGSIVGVIKEVDENRIIISDIDDQEWSVNIDKAIIPRSVFLEIGEKIKIEGTVISKQDIEAINLYPWGGKGMREKMQGERNKIEKNEQF
ncbi:MAG TPA: hypothetical protein PK147_04385 [Saprospiraceae bacterium]|nr:hypothetical protein [Saprospiraceae bacterium]HPQ21063.1 hypothetical protein [Saprospiraceae bacterium]HRX29535.1 hypothetical protein [Saprospiraceae bacterium]